MARSKERSPEVIFGLDINEALIEEWGYLRFDGFVGELHHSPFTVLLVHFVKHALTFDVFLVHFGLHITFAARCVERGQSTGTGVATGRGKQTSARSDVACSLRDRDSSHERTHCDSETLANATN